MSIRTSGSRPDDNSLRFTFIVEGRITKGNPPFAVVQRGKRCELVKGHDINQKVHDAFADPKNQLDDVDFSGWELKRARLIDQTVEDIERLGIAYARTMNLDPSAWHPKVRKFFTTQA